MLIRRIKRLSGNPDRISQTVDVTSDTLEKEETIVQRAVVEGWRGYGKRMGEGGRRGGGRGNKRRGGEGGGEGGGW